MAATTRAVDGIARLAAEPRQPALLEHAQQLGLRRQRQLADLVEEQRAAAGGLERAAAQPVGAGEGAALVAEQLALDELLRQRGAVDRDERRLLARPEPVQLARDQLLARAALARRSARVLGIGATRAIAVAERAASAALSPMSDGVAVDARRSDRTSPTMRPRESAFSISCTTRSIGSALSMNPYAPSRTAWTQRS